jgi:hypothetical protein
MKICLTGWNGFLASKLRECTDIEWTEEQTDSDALLLMGGPTFTAPELFQHDAHVMHQYVREAIKIIDRYHNPIIFASTTGVDDLRLDHKGSTSYNLGKLYLENYVLYNVDQPLILRIGTIYSTKLADVQAMKDNRVQSRVMRDDINNIPFEDYYLDVDTFVKQTIDAIKIKKTGILEYNLTKLRLTQLKTIAK